MSDIYMIVGDAGEPIAMVDLEKITDEGTALAFALAGYSDDPEALRKIQEDTLTRLGSKNFGYVAACALSTMTREILDPTFDLVEKYGTDVRTAMRDINEGRTPS